MSLAHAELRGVLSIDLHGTLPNGPSRVSGIPNLSAVGPAVLEMPNFIPIAAFGNIHVNNDECKCMCTPFTMILVTSRVHDRKCV